MNDGLNKFTLMLLKLCPDTQICSLVVETEERYKLMMGNLHQGFKNFLCIMLGYWAGLCFFYIIITRSQ